MALVPAKCTQCGGQIEVDDSKESGVCKHCGTEFMTEKVIQNYTTNYNVTNNITKIVNGKEIDFEEELLERALGHKKLGNIEEASEAFEELVNKYPNNASYHLNYVLTLTNDFKTLFLCDKDSIATKELNKFFKTVKKEEINKLCKDYGLESVEDFEKIKENLLNYSQDIYVSKILIPAYKNNSIEKVVFNNIIIPTVYENILKNLNEKNIKKIIKPATAYLEFVQEQSDSIEVITYEEERELTPEEEASFEYYQNLLKTIKKLHKKYKVEEVASAEQQENLKLLEAELEKQLEEKEKQKEKQKLKQQRINDFKLNLYMSGFLALVVFVIAHFVYYSKLPRESENRMGLAAKQALIIAVISIFVIFAGIYLIQYLLGLKKKLDKKRAERAKIKADKKFQKEWEKSRPERELWEQASKQLAEKIGSQAIKQMLQNDEEDKYKALVRIEMEKIKKNKK